MCDNTIIGYGASGKVELKRKFDILVAEKRMVTDGSSDTTRASAISESMLLMNLHHPNIVRVYAFHVFPCEVVLEMEYGGTELFRLVETLPDPLSVFRQVCEAVAYLHDMCIAHRDIKLENAVVDEKTWHVRLIDFGFARHFVHSHTSTERIGSVAYCSPDLWTRAYDVFCTDVWALGVLLFALAHRYYFPFQKACDDDAHFQRFAQAQASEGKTPSEALCAAHPNLTFVEWSRLGLDKTLALSPCARAPTARALLLDVA